MCMNTIQCVHVWCMYCTCRFPAKIWFHDAFGKLAELEPVWGGGRPGNETGQQCFQCASVLFLVLGLCF